MVYCVKCSAKVQGYKAKDFAMLHRPKYIISYFTLLSHMTIFYLNNLIGLIRSHDLFH